MASGMLDCWRRWPSCKPMRLRFHAQNKKNWLLYLLNCCLNSLALCSSCGSNCLLSMLYLSLEQFEKFGVLTVKLGLWPNGNVAHVVVPNSIKVRRQRLIWGGWRKLASSAAVTCVLLFTYCGLARKFYIFCSSRFCCFSSSPSCFLSVLLVEFNAVLLMLFCFFLLLILLLLWFSARFCPEIDLVLLVVVLVVIVVTDAVAIVVAAAGVVVVVVIAVCRCCLRWLLLFVVVVVVVQWLLSLLQGFSRRKAKQDRGGNRTCDPPPSYWRGAGGVLPQRGQ